MAKQTTVTKKTSNKKTNGNEKKTAAKKTDVKKKPAPDRVGGAVTTADKIIPFVLGILAAFFLLCFIFPSVSGVFGSVVKKLFFGLFGWGCIPVPIFMIVLAIMYLKLIKPYERKPHKGVVIQTVLALISVVALSAFVSVVTFGTEFSVNVSELYGLGTSNKGGGFIGGIIAMALCKCIGVFAPVLLFIVFFVCTILTFGLTPYRLYDIIKEKRRIAKEKALLEDDGEYGEDEEDDDIPFVTDEVSSKKPLLSSRKKQKAEKKKNHFDYETEDYVESEEDIGKSAYDYEKHNSDALPPKKAEKKLTVEKKQVKPEKTLELTEEERFDLDEIFSDNSSVKADKPVAAEIKTSPVGKSPEELASDAKAYRYPPMSLLKIDYNQQSADVSSELEANSKKLISTLSSFNVDARVVHISRGPTITRYELKLAPGIRVSAISKLVDNIAMEFAATGVRIEAPIPGKDAVGVEVPNSNIRIVRIRELLDTEKFRNEESKLTCALGVDVVGDPVYLDIAKMPHMLIAGATGMGKSVCINSLLISLLCKASPDDVRIMLIDPKKVEFVPYSGIPHLLVPVVTDPKKAAGALHWAVEEMERRYGLIESVGCRNIFGYNEATADDPEKEHLSQIVIVIDELADLMMTAKNDVETSICRIAQKARAAGMHLIVGTQRPSVDIVTGSIKANIPSRIACKTSSQIDSRTILDVAGAEKLIGRGDMLFAPVGITKPKRLQGAFVSDSEVEAVTSFIKKNYGAPSYSSGISDMIDKAAMQLSNSNKSMFDAQDSAEEEDEMLRPAIEFAFESGKVSTSLFQRKLSIGYGRAAKIIDRMQELGICSEASGNKPRELLITKEEYFAMMNEGDEI